MPSLEFVIPNSFLFIPANLSFISFCFFVSFVISKILRSSIIFFVLSYFQNSFIYVAAVLFLASNILFFINCLNAVRKYTAIAKTDPMDLSAFK